MVFYLQDLFPCDIFLENLFFMLIQEIEVSVVHPEQREDEFFFLNSSRNEDVQRLKRKWKTIRVGETAYLEGKKIEGLFPVFVKKDEVYNKKPHYQRYFEARNCLNMN